MASRYGQRLTIEAFERLREDGRRSEPVRGVGVRKPPAGYRHGEIGGTVLFPIVRHVREHGLGKVFAFPDLQATVDFVIAEGDVVAARWTMWGTATGPGPWGPPSGKPFRFSGINIYRFENGRTVEIWNHRDDLHWQRQLGVIPPARQPD